MMIAAELIFIPSPGVGHLASALQIARLLIDRDERLSITVLIMNLPSSLSSSLNIISPNSNAEYVSSTRIRFIELPNDDTFTDITNASTFHNQFVDSYKPHVTTAVSNLASSLSPDSPRLAGLVLDMFCSSMIDVADEFKIPTYVFFPSSVSFLGFMLHLQSLHDDDGKDITEFKFSSAELRFPHLTNPVPGKTFPSFVLDKDMVGPFLGHARRFRETKGIIVNTFVELESLQMKCMLENEERVPPIYPVGPILNIINNGEERASCVDSRDDLPVKKLDRRAPINSDPIMKWLDDQPLSSVVFLCFGSMGSFGEDQVKEIALALEKSGHRFLWSLREPPPKGTVGFPQDYANPKGVLPEGFLDRTDGFGKVIGWAPQVKVLGHPAVGGFVSHCGWNSAMESLWFGVPTAAWPIYAEQQFNAFEMVVELGLSEEIKMEYKCDFWDNTGIVTEEEIERGIRRLMEVDSEVRKKVKDMSQMSKEALKEGGSSHVNLGRFIENVFENVA